MGSVRDTLRPLSIAIVDLYVGGVLFQEVSVMLGLLMLVCGRSVLITVAYDPMNRAGSLLRQRVWTRSSSKEGVRY
jgi:hypothetical protein